MLFKYSKPLYSRDISHVSCSGSAEVPEYHIDFPPAGGVRLKQTGIIPLYEKIQANLANCDLKNVIDSCIHSNQYAVCTSENLNSLVADFTSLHNLGDIYAASRRMEHTWHDLPIEVREQFNSDFGVFINGIGTEEFDEKLNVGYSNFNETIRKNNVVGVVPPDKGNLNITPPTETEVIKPEKEVE